MGIFLEYGCARYCTSTESGGCKPLYLKTNSLARHVRMWKRRARLVHARKLAYLCKLGARPFRLKVEPASPWSCAGKSEHEGQWHRVARTLAYNRNRSVDRLALGIRVTKHARPTLNRMGCRGERMGNKLIPQNVALMAGRSRQNDRQRTNNHVYPGTLMPAPSPEPSPMLLLGTGLLDLALLAFRKAKSSGLAFLS
jgi:hypothetical protein